MINYSLKVCSFTVDEYIYSSKKTTAIFRKHTHQNNIKKKNMQDRVIIIIKVSKRLGISHTVIAQELYSIVDWNYSAYSSW